MMDFWRLMNVDRPDYSQVVGTNFSDSSYCRPCGVQPKNSQQTRDKRDQSIAHKPNDAACDEERSSGACSCGPVCTKGVTVARRKPAGDRVRSNIPRLCVPKPDGRDCGTGTAMKSAGKTEELLREADRHKTDRLRFEQRLKRLEVDLKRLQDERDELLLRIDQEGKNESEKRARAKCELQSCRRDEHQTAAAGQDVQLLAPPPPSAPACGTSHDQQPDASAAPRGYCAERRCNCRLSAAESTRPANRRAVVQVELLPENRRPRPEKTFAEDNACTDATRTTTSDRSGHRPSKEQSSRAREPTDRSQIIGRELPCDTLSSSSSSSHGSEFSDHTGVDEFCGPMPACMKKPYDVNDCVGKVCGYEPSRASKRRRRDEKNGWRNAKRRPQGKKDVVFTWEHTTPFDGGHEHHENTSCFAPIPK